MHGARLVQLLLPLGKECILVCPGLVMNIVAGLLRLGHDWVLMSELHPFFRRRGTAASRGLHFIGRGLKLA